MPAAFQPLTPLDDAWSRLQAAVQTHLSACVLKPESVASVDALGRVLAQDLTSTVDVPPLDNSAMDGYAVHAADLTALAQPGGVLAVAQRITAGQVGVTLAPGQTARIFTGAPVPAGTGAVVMQEHTEPAGEGAVRFTQPVHAGQNIRRRGEDIGCGQTVLSAGQDRKSVV